MTEPMTDDRRIPRAAGRRPGNIDARKADHEPVGQPNRIAVDHTFDQSGLAFREYAAGIGEHPFRSRLSAERDDRRHGRRTGHARHGTTLHPLR